MPVIQKGIATWVGIIGSVLTLVPPLTNQVIALIENTQAHWSGAEKLSVVAGAVIAGVTLIGRFAQAVVAIYKHGRA
jgi:TRAP-type mannitol/chloroaromatic compound transport system permease small subunit